MATGSRLDSYFPNVVHALTNSLGNGYYSGVATRPGDFYILRHQNPVGWEFFGKRNVAELIKACRKCKPTADFPDIVDDMVRIYEVYASETTQRPGLENIYVPRLNELFLQRFKQRCEIQKKNIFNYNKYLAKPHATAPAPTYEREDRTIRIDQRNPII